MSIVGPTPNFADFEFGDPAVDNARMILNDRECKALPVDDQIKEWGIAAMAKHGLLRGKGDLAGRYMILPGPRGARLQLGRSKLYSLVVVDEFTVRRAVELTIAKIAEQHGQGLVWFLGNPVRTMRDLGDGDGPRGCSRPGELPRVLLVSYYGHEKQAKEYV
jgi:hypothetical protein